MCYNDYKTSNKLEDAHSKLLELDNFEFLCPLCKSLCNFIFPATLQREGIEQGTEPHVQLQFKFPLPNTSNLAEFLDFEGLELLAYQATRATSFLAGDCYSSSQVFIFKNFKEEPERMVGFLARLIENSYQLERINSSSPTSSFL